VKVCI